MEETGEGAHGALRVPLPHLLVPVVVDADLPLRVHIAVHSRHHMILLLQTLCALADERSTLLLLLLRQGLGLRARL